MGASLEEVIKIRKAWAANDAVRDKDNVKPEDVTEYLNISYGPNEAFHHLNLYRPKGNDDVLPVIVSIHGGGYFYGSKELYSFYCMELSRYGFAVIDFDYRLVPEYTFPAPLEDTNAVLEWLYDNRNRYKLDEKNVFLVGDSAGAQICSQYAAIWSNPEYAALFSLKPPQVMIRAIGPACGMYDFPLDKPGSENNPRRNIVDDYLLEECFADNPKLHVLDYIDANYPPTFLITSYNDFLFGECEPMAAFLKNKGIDVEYKVYGTPEKKEIAHVFHVDFRYPEGDEARQDQIRFMKKHMK